jgi:YVTN family beta-propeller protein
MSLDARARRAAQAVRANVDRLPPPPPIGALAARRRRRATSANALVLALVVAVVGVAWRALPTGGRELAPTGGPVAPGRPVVAARIQLDRPLFDVEVGYGAVWVTSLGALARIDPASNRVAATIPTPLTGRFPSIAFGEGAVWVTSGQSSGVVYRIDPATNQVTATIPLPGGAFEIVVAAGTVWVSPHDPSLAPGSGPGEVVRIDARTNRLRSPVRVPGEPLILRYGLDAIWVTGGDEHVYRIDPRSGALAGPLGGVDNVNAVGGGALWGTYVNTPEDRGVLRADPATGRVVAHIRMPDSGVLYAFGLGTLWVAQGPPTTMPVQDGQSAPATPGKLYRIDPSNNRVLGEPIPQPGIEPTAVAVGASAVWVGERDGTTLTRFNLVS